MGTTELTYDEAALFNAYDAPTRRVLVDRLTTGIPYIEDPELHEIAQTLKHKIKAMSQVDYLQLHNKRPLPDGF